MKYKYSIVIPCYNEEKNLGRLISSLGPLVDQYDVEFLLVENGSNDNSRQILHQLIDERTRGIKPVYVDGNRGYGYGIQQGLKAAQGDYVGWIHADMQMHPSELAAFFDEIEHHSKSEKIFLKGRRTNRHPLELLFTYGQTVFTSCLFGRKLYDIGATPSLFSRTLLDEVPIYKMPNDFSIDIFVYAEAKIRNYTILRPQVSVHDRENGVSSWNSGIKSRIKQSKRIISDSIKIRIGKKVF